jgi:two-component system, OmpR family, response regulator
MMRILIVEDEPEMALLMTRRLARAGFDCDRTASIAEAVEALRLFPYSLVLLDRRLPDGDSADHTSTFRELRPNVPIMMVTALDAYRERVAGLDAGADDYLTKPFNGPEFLARVRARLRQASGGSALPPIVVGRLSFDQQSQHLTIADKLFHIHKRELTLLGALMRRANRVATRPELANEVYGLDREVSAGALDTLVSRLRKRLAEVDANVEIHLVRGRGYLLTESAS